MSSTTFQYFPAYVHFTFKVHLLLNRAALPCYHGSTSARYEPPPTWRLWPRIPDQVWARPVLPRCTAPCNPAGDPHPESPLHWRGAAARQTGHVTTRRGLCWIQGQLQRALPPESRCSPLHLLQRKTKTVNEEHGKKFRRHVLQRETIVINKKQTVKLPRMETGVKGMVWASLIRLFLSIAVNTQHNTVNTTQEL